MMTNRVLAKVLFMLLLLIVSGCSSQSPVEAILHEVVKEYGGKANLEKLNSWTAVWNMQAKMRGVEGVDTRNIALPDKLRVTIDYEISSETRMLNGDKGFRVFSGRVMPAEGPPLLAMKQQLMRFYTPLTLLKRKDDLTLSEQGGYKVLSLKDGDITGNYWINPKTNRIERFTGTFSMGGGVMEFRTEYSDFRVVQGVLLHHMEDKYAGGMNTATLTLKEVRFNEKFPPEVFKR